jgi:hypothetical protein
VVAAALYLRLENFGRFGFWNDEAWVALSTRVDGAAQFWLSLSVTPILWAVVLRLWAIVGAAPEYWLRLLPCAWSCLTLWAAYRAGTRFAAHAFGGVLALAVIAFEPRSVEQAKLLKHYSAEAFFGVLAFVCAGDAARGGRAALIRLGATLCLGVGFSNAQVLLAPPIIGALCLRALVRRDGQGLRRLALLAAVVGTWDAIAYRALVGPRLSGALDAYWVGVAPVAPNLAEAFTRVVKAFFSQLASAWGMWGGAIALACLPAIAFLRREAPIAVVGLMLLVAELAVLAYLRPFPAHVPRVTLFALTAINVYAAAAVAAIVLALWRHPRARPALPLGLALLAYSAATQRAWTRLGDVSTPEDLGPLVRIAEDARTPQDRLLLYGRSTYVYAYYRDAPPVLDPAPNTVGFVPRLDDSRLTVVDGATVDAAIAAALGSGARVWMLGSRFYAADESRFRNAAAAHGRILREERRMRALLLLVAGH